MESLIIFDYTTSTLDIYDIDSDTDIDEDYLRKLGFNPDTCSWMFGTNIEIHKHKEVLK